jgi:uncharacterized GH25 family protein
MFKSTHRVRVRTALLAGATLFASSSAMAHYPWLLSSAHAPAEGQTATIYLAWGHKFPLESFMDRSRIDKVSLVSADGGQVGLEATDSGYVTPRLTPGVNMVLASQKSGFFTRTRQGSKRQSKEGLKDVIRCSYSSNNMKTILNVGNGSDGLNRATDQPLDIIPLSNPAKLKVGDRMNVRITMRGEPYSGMVYATYAGFSTEGAYAYTVETDNEGKASIRILHPGQWLVRARVEQEYPDRSVCDIEAYTSTLTFAIP